MPFRTLNRKWAETAPAPTVEKPPNLTDFDRNPPTKTQKPKPLEIGVCRALEGLTPTPETQVKP